MWNAPEVVRKVGVHDFRVTTEQLRFHLDPRLLGISPRTVRVLFGWKIGFEDRFQHQHRCRHADPIPHGRDAGWDLHPLESAAFARRTPKADNDPEGASRCNNSLKGAAGPALMNSQNISQSISC